MEATMQRGSELLAKIVREPTWKRIERLMPEAAELDPRAAAIFLVGLAAVLAACAAAQ